MTLSGNNIIKKLTLKTPSALLIFLASALLCACSRPADLLYEEQIFALGALVNISIWDVDATLANRASAELTADFNQLHRTWHAWQPSPLTRINAELASGKAVTVAPELLPLLMRARELSLASNGLFNPAIGKLFGLWGFQADERADAPPPAAPTVSALLALKPGMADLTIEGTTLRSSNPALQLDLGAIGQGYAADRAVSHLRKLGILNAIVNVSGDIRVIGTRGDRPWRIGIRNPRGAGIIASLSMQGDESIVTSGSYERFFTFAGQRYCHIIDPRSGYPVTTLTSVTVLHSDATTADAASTALMVAGPQNWQQVARAMGIKHVMLIDATGQITITPALAKRMNFEVSPAPRITISAAL